MHGHSIYKRRADIGKLGREKNKKIRRQGINSKSAHKYPHKKMKEKKGHENDIPNSTLPHHLILEPARYQLYKSLRHIADDTHKTKLISNYLSSRWEVGTCLKTHSFYIPLRSLGERFYILSYPLHILSLSFVPQQSHKRQ